MNHNLNPCLTEPDLAEFETALAELSSTERHVLFRLMELHPIEDVLDIIACMEDGDEANGPHFIEHDPYAKCAPVPHPQNQNIQMNEDGCICVKNPSACWVPELTLHRQIGGTVYTVTGSYSGSGMLDKKLLRVMEQNAEIMEDSE